MSKTFTGYEIALQVRNILPLKTTSLIRDELFKSRCDITPAIDKLQKHLVNLQVEINQVNAAIDFLSKFKGTKS